MKLKFKYTGYFVSVFIIAAAVLFIVLLVLLTVDKKFFADKTEYKTVFYDAEGLSSSTPVELKGYKIGRVSDHSLAENNTVDVSVYIYSDYTGKVKENSVFEKIINPITGTAIIEFHPGTGKPLAEGKFIPSADFDEGKYLMARLDVKNSDELLYSVLNNLNIFLSEFSLKDSAGKSKLPQIANNLMVVSENLAKVSGEVDGIVKGLNYQFAQNSESPWNRTLTNFASGSSKLSESLVKLDSAMASLQTLAKNYNDPDSLLVRMLDPGGKEIIKPVNALVENISDVVDKHKDFAESLNANTTNIETILDDLEILLLKLHGTIELINNNPIINYNGKDGPLRLPQGDKTRLKD